MTSFHRHTTTLYDQLHRDAGLPILPQSPKHLAVQRATVFINKFAECVLKEVELEDDPLVIDVAADCESANSVQELLHNLTDRACTFFLKPCLRVLYDFHCGVYKEQINWREFVSLQSSRLAEHEKNRDENNQSAVDKQAAVDAAYKTMHGRELYRIWDMITFGIHNAAHTEWSLQAVIPAAFQSSFNRSPSQDELSTILRSTNYTPALLRSGEDNVFHFVLNRLRAGVVAFPWPPYKPDAFTITEGLTLEPSAWVFAPPPTQHLQGENPQPEMSLPPDPQLVRGGCPGGALSRVVQSYCNRVALNWLPQSMERLLTLPLLAEEGSKFLASGKKKPQLLNEFIPFDDLVDPNEQHL